MEQLDAVADEAVAQGSWFEVTMERRLYVIPLSSSG